MAMNVEAFKKSDEFRTSIDATIPNTNQSSRFYWMRNKKGVLVPMAPHNLKDALEKGYQHTDGKLNVDDPRKHYRFGKTPESHNPLDKLTNTISKLIESKPQQMVSEQPVEQIQEEVVQPEIQEEEIIENDIEDHEISV